MNSKSVNLQELPALVSARDWNVPERCDSMGQRTHYVGLGERPRCPGYNLSIPREIAAERESREESGSYREEPRMNSFVTKITNKKESVMRNFCKIN